MLKLEQIQKNAAITGLEPGQVVRIVTTEPVGDNALTVYYVGQREKMNRMRAKSAIQLNTLLGGRSAAFFYESGQYVDDRPADMCS